MTFGSLLPHSLPVVTTHWADHQLIIKSLRIPLRPGAGGKDWGEHPPCHLTPPPPPPPHYTNYTNPATPVTTIKIYGGGGVCVILATRSLRLKREGVCPTPNWPLPGLNNQPPNNYTLILFYLHLPHIMIPVLLLAWSFWGVSSMITFL